ncbi:hypothetical protein Y88_3786 [Novosphingobium nitrogenifigens DSM 19370]|uniref:Lipoprotein n=1 Tax=Novosphingobium nitrogenifigens DSM 19370 TaxID=983920 RepID=F1ZD37_9SPHN|nr:hypothetical protein [Novosphingobium nitrogenifigens]EGD57476.1 hypothetical protein Y88_3786 [Novosphingobium nitrogenifigens DSM 19370]
MKSKLILALAGAASLLTFATPSMAADWGQRHPRQAEVLAREHHQIHRINAERRRGEITGREARALRASDRAIARQDRAYARANGGRITRAEQHRLNAEENATSRAIGH